jgi:hypothetical protein
MSQKSSPPSTIPKPPPPVLIQTRSGKLVEKILLNLLEPIDLIGQKVMGEFWKPVYLAVQDAVGLAVMLKLPSAVAHVLIGTDFSGYNVCINESPWGVSRYACFLIVTADFCMWTVIAGRILGRFIAKFIANLQQARKQIRRS